MKRLYKPLSASSKFFRRAVTNAVFEQNLDKRPVRDYLVDHARQNGSRDRLLPQGRIKRISFYRIARTMREQLEYRWEDQAGGLPRAKLVRL